MPRGRPKSRGGGKLYPNRSDMTQPVQTAPGQTYGAQAAQADAQRAIPIPRSAPGAGMGVGGPPAAPPPPPGGLGFDDPTQNPDEPVTAGLTMGAGPGPEAIPQMQAPPSILEMLASLPDSSPEVRALASSVAMADVPANVLAVDLDVPDGMDRLPPAPTITAFGGLEGPTPPVFDEQEQA